MKLQAILRINSMVVCTMHNAHIVFFDVDNMVWPVIRSTWRAEDQSKWIPNRVQVCFWHTPHKKYGTVSGTVKRPEWNLPYYFETAMLMNRKYPRLKQSEYWSESIVSNNRFCHFQQNVCFCFFLLSLLLQFAWTTNLLQKTEFIYFRFIHWISNSNISLSILYDWYVLEVFEKDWKWNRFKWYCYVLLRMCPFSSVVVHEEPTFCWFAWIKSDHLG